MGSAAFRMLSSIGFFITSISLSIVPQYAQGITRHYEFNIKMQNVTRLCHTKNMVTVNGKFPGPRVVAREGDRLVIKVTNHVASNISLHWHGIRQLRSGWADGPAYITQCPIQTGQSYVYNFTVVGQRGTFWWHGHISWLRSTLYGPLIILPKHNVPYPFEKPYKEVPVIFGAAAADATRRLLYSLSLDKPIPSGQKEHESSSGFLMDDMDEDYEPLVFKRSSSSSKQHQSNPQLQN
ncbi:unnamed protein product [Fraxinus pennsylvanica]|uniref:Plastocyanin-like domain-containing protein n=1 Tax=Fraxinus pennsylvanica TaxID=56036 RepID=A0AAD1Z0A1_9LAMI|nr:unnamed protein product [Fraxinus pennsylvanica]